MRRRCKRKGMLSGFARREQERRALMVERMLISVFSHAFAGSNGGVL